MVTLWAILIAYTKIRDWHNTSWTDVYNFYRLRCNSRSNDILRLVEKACWVKNVCTLMQVEIVCIALGVTVNSRRSLEANITYTARVSILFLLLCSKQLQTFRGSRLWHFACSSPPNTVEACLLRAMISYMIFTVIGEVLSRSCYLQEEESWVIEPLRRLECKPGFWSSWVGWGGRDAPTVSRHHWSPKQPAVSVVRCEQGYVRVHLAYCAVR